MQPFVKVRNWVDSGLLPGQPLDHNWKPWELAETDHNRDTGDSWSSKENAPFANPLHYLVITCSFEDVQYHERFKKDRVLVVRSHPGTTNSKASWLWMFWNVSTPGGTASKLIRSDGPQPKSEGV